MYLKINSAQKFCQIKCDNFLSRHGKLDTLDIKAINIFEPFTKWLLYKNVNECCNYVIICNNLTFTVMKEK